jgi:hypothetical protein
LASWTAGTSGWAIMRGITGSDSSPRLCSDEIRDVAPSTREENKSNPN